jgi:ABC-type branched-subunit amino acid transport system permease subunit
VFDTNTPTLLGIWALFALSLGLMWCYAGILSFAKNVIMVTAGIIMVRTGFHFLSEDGKAEISGIQYILGFMIIVMGFKLASTGLDGLTSKPKATK